MFTGVQQQTNQSTANRGNAVSARAHDCTAHARAARGLWPEKTAFHWAAVAGTQERIVKYWLSGARPVSDTGKLALIRYLDH